MLTLTLFSLLVVLSWQLKQLRIAMELELTKFQFSQKEMEDSYFHVTEGCPKNTYNGNGGFIYRNWIKLSFHTVVSLSLSLAFPLFFFCFGWSHRWARKVKSLFPNFFFFFLYIDFVFVNSNCECLNTTIPHTYHVT